MAKKEIKETKKQVLKKMRDNVRQKMESLFPDLKLMIGDKEFIKRIKKASSLLSDGISLPKNKKENKKDLKKKSKKD